MKKELNKNMDYYKNIYEYNKILSEPILLINKFKLYSKK